MKITSWNVNGIRAAVKKDFLKELKKSKSDIYCLQETKAQDEQVLEALADVKGYTISVTSAVKKGYSGVAILSKNEPINCLLYTSPSPRDRQKSRMPSSA